jgi:cytochrome c
MKKIIVIVMILFLASCKKEENKISYSKDKDKNAKNPIDLGKTLFEGEGNCIACHQIDQKIIGPSLQEIAKKYKEEGASIVSFLKEESEPIIDPSQYEIMKTNFAITEQMSDTELKALEAYIFYFSK